MKRDTFILERFSINYIPSHYKYDISNKYNCNNSINIDSNSIDIDSSTLKKDTLLSFFRTSFLKNILLLYILLILMIPSTFCKSVGKGITGNLQTKTGDPLILKNNRLIIQKHNKNNHRNNRNDNHNTPPLFELENESKLIFRDKGDRKKYVHIRNKNLELTSKKGLENLDFKRQTVYSVRDKRKGRSGVFNGEEVVFVPNNNSNSNSNSRSSRSSKSRGSSSRNRSKSKSRRRDSSDAKSSSSSSQGSSNQRDGAFNKRDGGYDSDTSSALENQRSDSSHYSD